MYQFKEGGGLIEIHNATPIRVLPPTHGRLITLVLTLANTNAYRQFSK
jgi:hypothetical protein